MGYDERRCPVVTPGKKAISRPSYAVNIDNTCVVCKKAKHPHYFCKMFHALSHKRKMGMVKNNKLCLNCLGSGYFLKECLFGQKCKSVTSHAIRGYTSMPRVRIVRHLRRAWTLGNHWTLLQPMFHGLFRISKCCWWRARFRYLAWMDHASQSIVGLCVVEVVYHWTLGAAAWPKAKLIDINISGIVLRKVTFDLPSSPTPFNKKWKHLWLLTPLDHLMPVVLSCPVRLPSISSCIRYALVQQVEGFHALHKVEQVKFALLYDIALLLCVLCCTILLAAWAQYDGAVSAELYHMRWLGSVHWSWTQLSRSVWDYQVWYYSI